MLSHRKPFGVVQRFPTSDSASERGYALIFLYPVVDFGKRVTDALGFSRTDLAVSNRSTPESRPSRGDVRFLTPSVRLTYRCGPS